MNEITRTLERLRRRMVAQFFFERFAVCALVSGAVLVAVGGVNALRTAGLFDARLGVAALIGAILAAFAWALAKSPTLEQAAIRADTLAQTRDRLLTAHAFSKAANPTAPQLAALAECRRFVAAFDPARCTPFRIPPLLRWLAVPLVALAMLAWHSGSVHSRREENSVSREADARSQEMEKLAREIEKANEKEKSDDLKKIAEEIRKGAERLRNNNAGAPEKAALREMSSLEDMLKEMMDARKTATPEELAAMAAALKNAESMKDVAAALQAGKPGDAAEKLEQLLKQKDGAQLDQAAKAVQQALSQLSQSQQGELSRELAKSGAGNGAQALQRMAELLRKAGNAQQGQGDGNSQQSQQAMQNILSAIQNMKYGGQQPQMTAGQQPMGGAGKTLVQSFGNSAANGGQPLAGNIPSGSPGSEHDTGTTENPFGAQQKKGAESGAGTQLSGTMGEGESLHDFISSTGDTSKSGRRYRDLYDAMLPAAEKAVEQENIPLGSRFYIKRYFEAIRPKE
jgi:hypothetical protein